MSASDFKLLGYRISKIHFEIDDTYDFSRCKINNQINILNNFNEDNDRFVEVVLDVNVKSEDEKIKFFIQIKAGFQANEKMDQDLFEKLAKHNGPAIIFPFARAIITSYTAQANIPSIILPVVNFAPSKKDEGE